MSGKAKSGRDVFRFSLSGLRVMAAYSAATAIADDQINKAWDEKFRQAQEAQGRPAAQAGSISGRFWLSRRHRTA